MMIQRPFSSGSRQAPDPHDIFLEESGFYRKHTARDSSCLFRAISEQMYDTQNHHLTLRESCVTYMRKNKLYYQNRLKQYALDVDIDDYLDELSKTKTFGNLLELEAMAHMFARNIVLFRPLELGQCFIYKPNFAETFQIFVSHDRHFDTVYKNNFIEDAAFCQSIVYEMLYKHVFKLPDITYAVERMLHASSFEEIDSTNDGMYCRQIYLKDGRSFELDTPENTCCILNNYKLCHFHNEDFVQMAEMLQNDVNKFETSYSESKTNTSSDLWFWKCNENSYNGNGSYFYPNNMDNTINENDYYDCNSCLKQLHSLLPEKYISCVRQLLYEGITPFPYKVAKALDPDMYRNIEFDSWSEMRKEQRWKNCYIGGSKLQLMSFPKIKGLDNKLCILDKNCVLQVGVKCQVYLRKQDEFYTGYIQEMPDTPNGPCVVFIAELGERRTVPFDCLKPLPPDQIKPWPLPYPLQKQFEKYQQQQSQMYSPSKFFKRFANHHTKLNSPKMIEWDNCEPYSLDQSFNEKEEINFRLKQYCNLDNFNPAPMEIITLPLSIENDRTPLSSNSQISQNKTFQQTPLNSVVSCNNKTDETPSRPPSSTSQHISLQQNSQSDMIESTYLEDHNIHGEQNSVSNASIQDCAYQYPIYNYYPDPYYPYHQCDNSIIHATIGGQPYYCFLANSASNIVQPTGQPGVFMSSSPQLNTGQAYYPAPAVLQPVLSQPIANNLSNRNIVNVNGNGSCAVQKSLMESGVDLPNDVETLRYFYNLGCDYYNELNDSKNKESENGVSKLTADFQNIKIENENNQEKSDSNNNVMTRNSSVSENSTGEQFNSNHNNQHNNYSTRNNNTKYNNMNNNGRNSENKQFSSRCFNNRKTGNFNRGNGVMNNRVMQGSRNRNNGGNNSNNSKNENRSQNSNNNGNKGSGKADSYQKAHNNNVTNEADSSNATDVNSCNKNNESIENVIQTSPFSTTSENSETNQNSTVPLNTSQSITSSTYAMSSYQVDHSNSSSNEQYTTITSFNGGPNTNNGIFVPQVINSVPFEMCQTIPPPNAITQTYNGIQNSGITQGSSYPYLAHGTSRTINTSHPPPPLPNMGTPIHTSQANGLSISQPAPYSIQTSHLPHTYYYPLNVPPPGAGGVINSNASETSNSSSIGGGGMGAEMNTMVNYGPESTGPYSFSNIPVYYTPTNNGGLTPTGNNLTGHLQSGGSVNATGGYQGYWFASAPVPQMTMATPTYKKK